MNLRSLAQFEHQAYLNLETYRKNGEAVPTPVWFVEKDGLLYVRTFAEAGKVKRIRRNPKVRVVPCTANGKPRGEWVSGEAQIVAEPGLANQINELLRRKYGLVKALLEWVARLRGGAAESIVIAIRPLSE